MVRSRFRDAVWLGTAMFAAACASARSPTVDERVRVEVRAGTGAVIDSGYVSGAEKPHGAPVATTSSAQPEAADIADRDATPTKMVP